MEEEVKIKSPQEYRHTMSTIINGLISRGLEIISFKEEVGLEFRILPQNSCFNWLYIYRSQFYIQP